MKMPPDVNIRIGQDLLLRIDYFLSMENSRRHPVLRMRLLFDFVRFRAAGGLVCALVLLLCPAAPGAPVDKAQAEKLARNWIQAGPGKLDPDMKRSVRKSDTYKDGDQNALYHVIHLAPKGFVVVAADDDVEPIVAFSGRSDYVPSPDNPLTSLLDSDLAGRVQLARKQGRRLHAVERAAQRANGKWRQLAEQPLPLLEGDREGDGGGGTGLVSVADTRVAPLLETHWDQSTVAGSNVYNYYTPSNYYCGCLATAMAQFMRYFRRPVQGVGTNSFSITVSGVPDVRSLRGGDGNGGPYAWDDMVAVPDGGTTETQRQAIGALCHDAGVSVNTAYAADVSLAAIQDAATALVATFGYSNSASAYNSGWNLGPNLNNMVNPNLDAAIPVLLAIQRASGNHAVVCDGYGYDASTLYHHINMGHGPGGNDAWYNLPEISTYTSVYRCVYNLLTNGTGEIISGRITDTNSTPVAAAVITAVRSGGGAWETSSDTNGIYALAGVPPNSTYALTVAKTNCAFAALTVSNDESLASSLVTGNRWGVDFQQLAHGEVYRFAWSNVPASVTQGKAFAMDVTALDGYGDPVPSFTNSVQFLARKNRPAVVEVGTNLTTWSHPLRTDYRQSRTQVIYRSGELGPPAVFDGLSLFVTVLPGEDLTDFTIRMKHTDLSSYTTYAWDTGPWTTCLQANVAITNIGWVHLPFSNAFSYAGSGNVLVDFTVNNPTNSTTGYCRFTGTTGSYRALFGVSNGADGDPLNWTGTAGGILCHEKLLNVRLSVRNDFAVTPASVAFTNGAWSGVVAVPQAFTNVSLVASDTNAHTGASDAFDIIPVTLQVVSDYGTPYPAAGLHELGYGASVTCSVPDSPYFNPREADFDVGAGAYPYNQPLRSAYWQSRTQVIYLTNQLGSAASFVGLALNVNTRPNLTLTNWTIRAQHTSKTNFNGSRQWETSGWQVVYAGNAAFSTTGLCEFAFAAPFDYNGRSNVMLDFSFNNTSAGSNGFVATAGAGGGQLRLCYTYTNGSADPLEWTGLAAYTSTNIPNLRLLVSSNEVPGHCCYGWIGTENVPAGGSTTSTPGFVLTTNSAITWLWQTNFLVTVATSGSGTVDRAGGWYVKGTNLTLTASPGLYFDFGNWSGDTGGCVIAGAQVEAPMTRNRRLTALFVPEVITNNTPVWWMVQHDLGTNDSDAVADADFDRVPNWKEYVAGTDPTNILSLLQMTHIAPAAGQQCVLRWASVSGKTYRVEISTNLPDGFSVLETNIAATPGENIYTNVPPEVPRIFYRVTVTP